MSEWITDRRPIEHYESYVYDSFGNVCHRIEIANGQPWKPIPKSEPYVKRKRFRVLPLLSKNTYDVYDGDKEYICAGDIPTFEAAERIAAIYEEVMP